MTSGVVEVAMHSPGGHSYPMVNEIPTVDQLTDDAAVVLGFMLRSASDPSHQNSKKRSDDVYSHSFQFTPLKLDTYVSESLDSDNGDACDAAVTPDTPGPGILYNAVTAVSSFLKHPFGSHNIVPVAESKDERKQFHERTISEKEVILEHVADELARIADSFNAEYANSNMSRSESGNSGRRNISASVSSSVVSPATPVYRHCSSLQDVADSALSPAERLCQVVHNHNAYDEFEQVLHENVGEQVDWSALAQMFRLTQTAVQHMGTGSAAADQIQAFTLRYFRDRFAPWIATQGGWSPVMNSRNRQAGDDSQLD